MTTLNAWIARQRRHAIAGLLRCISPRQVKQRPGFGQVIVPKPGAVVASAVLGDWDPAPDYFFHWYRDSALIVDALRLVQGEVNEAKQLFADFVAFSRGLAGLDGRALPPDWQARAAPNFARFLRRDAAQVHGDAVLADTRVNADGTLDISDWPRPQHDGPALRALAVLRWGVPGEAAAALLEDDLRFLLAHARQPCFDIWEEEQGLHYYTLQTAYAALRLGGGWFASRGADFAVLCRDEADRLAKIAGGFWSDSDGFIRSRQLAQGASAKELDIAVILAANHAGLPPDERHAATLDKLAALFAHSYPINRDETRGPAMGRYADDVYFSGGAYFFATLAAAEYCYRVGDGNRGDVFLETVRRFAPTDGQLPEQFDKATGAPSSAPDLGWSHAAFLTCIAARQALME